MHLLLTLQCLTHHDVMNTTNTCRDRRDVTFTIIGAKHYLSKIKTVTSLYKVLVSKVVVILTKDEEQGIIRCAGPLKSRDGTFDSRLFAASGDLS
jgi:hypothetical protein